MLIDDIYALKCSQPNGRSKEISLICAKREAASQLGFASLKSQQLKAILAFCEGKDVFVSLPTGFGKTLIFAVFPSLFNTPALSLRPNSKLRFLLSGTFFLHTQ